MKKRLNTVFFSMAFLAAILLEVYCILRLDGDILSVGGIGIVVLITGYLLLESVKDNLIRSKDLLKNYIEEMYQEEALRQKDRSADIIQLMKATYSAMKKNTVIIQESLGNLQNKIEASERNREKDMIKLMDLQKKSLEGQKNALHMQLNYDNQNTKNMIKAIQEDSSKEDLNKGLKQIAELIEFNNKLIQETLIQMNASNRRTQAGMGFEADHTSIIHDLTGSYYPEDDEDSLQPDDLLYSDFDQDNQIYKDEGRSLNSRDDAEFAEDDGTDIYAASWDTVSEDENLPEQETDFVSDEDLYAGSDPEPDTVLDETTSDDSYLDPVKDMPEEDLVWNEYSLSDSYLPETAPEESIAKPEQKEASTVVPIYDDPNKALTADEIASLFASFGN